MKRKLVALGMLMLAIIATSFLTGCAATMGAALGAAVGGPNVKSMGDNKYLVEYSGPWKKGKWLAECAKTCGCNNYDIIQYNSEDNGSLGNTHTGIIKCQCNHVNNQDVMNEKNMSDVTIEKNTISDVLKKFGKAENVVEFKAERVVVMEYTIEKELNLLGFSYDESRYEMVLRAIKTVNTPELYYKYKQGDKNAYEAQLRKIFDDLFKESKTTIGQAVPAAGGR